MRWIGRVSFVLILVGTPRPSAGSVVVRLSLEDLTRHSDRVVVARLTSKHAAWGPKNLRIYTTHHFLVQTDVAGSGPRRITVVQPGGTVGELSQKTFGHPSFSTGQEALLFLGKDDQRYHLVGMSQGVFTFERAGVQEWIVQKLDGLRFVRDSGEPLVLKRTEALQRIRSLWKKRQVLR